MVVNKILTKLIGEEWFQIRFYVYNAIKFFWKTLFINVFFRPENLKNERNPIKMLQKGPTGPENRKYISNRIMGLAFGKLSFRTLGFVKFILGRSGFSKLNFSKMYLYNKLAWA